MDMDMEFPAWCREVSITTANADYIDKRWQAVSAFVEAYEGDTDQLLSLGCLFHNINGVDGDFELQFKTFFQKADSSFLMEGNPHELSIMAGAVLAQLLRCELDYAIDIVIGLILISTKMHGRRTAGLDAIVARGGEYLQKKRSEIRNLAPLEVDQSDYTILGKMVEDLEEQVDPNTVAEVSEPLLALLGQLVGSISEIGETLAVLIKHQPVYREDSQMLWWLTGEYSRDLNRPIKDLDSHTACMLIGKELADLTQNFPGPFSYLALLDKMLSNIQTELPDDNSSSMSVYDVINISDRDWKSSLQESFYSSDVLKLCPILFAIKKSLESSSKTAWASPFESQFDIKKSTKLSALEFAEQMYNECLLVKTHQAILD